MKLSTFVVSLAVCSVSLITHDSATADVVFDMGAGNIQSIPVTSGPMVVRIINKTIAKEYTSAIRIENIAIDALTPPAKIGKPFETKELLSAKAAGKPCDELTSLSGKAAKTRSERELSQIRRQWEAKQKELKEKCRTEVAAGGAVFRATEQEFPVTNLKSGQSVVITMTASSSDSQPEEVWTFTATTQPKGHWVGSWGMAIVPNKDRDYYAKPDGTGAFIVTEKQADDSVNLIPAVFYTWIARDNELDSITHGFAGGIGLDDSSLSLLFGYNFTYNRNLSLNLGGIVHQQRRLKGEFSSGQTINDALTSDALTESVYKVNGFLAMGLRF